MTRGFKLASLALVAVVLVVLAGSFLLSRICPDCGKPREEWNNTFVINFRLDLVGVARDIRTFSKQHGRLPSTMAEIYAKPLMDPWGQQVAYEALPEGRYVLRSAGPDGRFGTDDDVTRGVDAKVDAEFDVLVEQIGRNGPAGSASRGGP